MTTEIASKVFGQTNRAGTLPTWEELAAKARYSAPILARICGVSLRTMQRHFRENYEMSVCDWLNTLRLERAYERLRAGGRVKEVACDLGYKQLSNFSRAFKERYGFRPTELYFPGAGSTNAGQVVHGQRDNYRLTD